MYAKQPIRKELRLSARVESHFFGLYTCGIYLRDILMGYTCGIWLSQVKGATRQHTFSDGVPDNWFL